MRRCPQGSGSGPNMAFRLLALGLCAATGLCPGQRVEIGESAPLRADSSTSGSTPVQQVLALVDPQADGSISELQAGEIEEFLAGLASDLVSGELNLDGRVAPEFQGTPLSPAAEEPAHSQGELQSFHGTPQTERSVTSDSLDNQFDVLLSDYRSVDWAKFKVVGIEPQGPRVARATLRFQLAGVTHGGYRQQIRVDWKSEWKRSPEDRWLLSGIQAGPSERSRARVAAFEDISETAFGRNDSFHQQLKFGTEVWRTRMDAASGMDVYGQQGLAVGDYDGDGLEDFYLTQPGGLPNRLFRNLGNGRFADVSTRAGLDALDGSSAALFADIENNGTQDLIVILSTGQPLLFLNGGSGDFRLSRKGFPLGLKPEPSGAALAIMTLMAFWIYM